MIENKLSVNALTKQEYALKLLQTPADEKGETKTISATATLSFAPDTGNETKSRLLEVLLDAMGNATVKVEAEDGQAGVGTGDGNDTVSISATQAGASTGAGNDTINIRTSGAYFYQGDVMMTSVTQVSAGDGDDSVTIESHGNVDRTYGGAGNDKIIINSSSGSRDENYIAGVDRTYGGDGDDEIGITSATDVWVADGGGGNDIISITAKGRVDGATGGAGNDKITVDADSANAGGGDGDDEITVHGGTYAGAGGGAGNDKITAIGKTAEVSGGTGDDNLVFQVEERAIMSFNKGDGHDSVETNKPLEIRRNFGGGAEGAREKTVVSRNDDGSLTVSFKDSDDTITAKFTGEFANSTDVSIEFFNERMMISPTQRTA